MPDRALVIVDVQYDFLPGGALGVSGGDKIVPLLNKYARLVVKHGFAVYASRDWHPPVTKHFKEYGGDWPPHCVQGTAGAEFHPDLELPEGTEIVSKGMDPERDSYSAFDAVTAAGKSLEESLKERGVKHIYIGGLATDYCVKYTVLESLQKGFRATVLMDAVKGVDVEAGDSIRAIEAMIRAGARMANLKDVEEELAAER